MLIEILVKKFFDSDSKTDPIIKDRGRSLLLTLSGTVNAPFTKDIDQTKHKAPRVTLSIN